jgi:hypothetical protein
MKPTAEPIATAIGSVEIVLAIPEGRFFARQNEKCLH